MPAPLQCVGSGPPIGRQNFVPKNAWKELSRDNTFPFHLQMSQEVRQNSTFCIGSSAFFHSISHPVYMHIATPSYYDFSILPLVYFHTVDDPVSICKCSRISRNIICTSGVFCRVALVTTCLLPEISLSRIRSTECQIKDNIVRLEVVVHGARASLCVEGWKSPG